MQTRRDFVKAAAGFAAASGLSFPAHAQSRPRVVVIGGGAGGVSVVRVLVKEAEGKLDIVLVEPKSVYTTCFYSNLYLGGFQSFGVLQHRYDQIGNLPGVTHAVDRAKSIDRDRKIVLLAGGQSLAYDRLVLSPGISLDYDSVPGWSKEAEQKMPHAWQAGEQTQLLKRQLDAVPDGGLVVVIPPPNPSRCPPGPYERVSMMAHALKSSGRGKARIVVLDPKDKFSKQALFQQAWEKHYPGMIEWMPPMIHSGIRSINPETMSVQTGFETYKAAALVNVIPRQRAGQIALDAGLVGDNGFCPVDPYTMASRMDANIHVLGDASIAGDMPKSAFAANSQAGVVAGSIMRALLGSEGAQAEYANKCWSLLGEDDSVFVGGSYKPTDEKIEQTQTDISSLEDKADTRRKNYEDSAGWYAALTRELFG